MLKVLIIQKLILFVDRKSSRSENQPADVYQFKFFYF